MVIGRPTCGDSFFSRGGGGIWEFFWNFKTPETQIVWGLGSIFHPAILRILVQVNFWSPKTCFSPRALALGSLASSSPRKDPQKSLLWGYSLRWFFSPTWPSPTGDWEGERSKRSRPFLDTQVFFVFFILGIRNAIVHPHGMLMLEWDAGMRAGFFCPNLVKIPPKLKLTKKEAHEKYWKVVNRLV